MVPLSKILGSIILLWLYLMISMVLTYAGLSSCEPPHLELWGQVQWGCMYKNLYSQDWGYIPSEKISVCCFHVHWEFHFFLTTFVLIPWLRGSWTICWRDRAIMKNSHGSPGQHTQASFEAYLLHLKGSFLIYPLVCQSGSSLGISCRNYGNKCKYKPSEVFEVWSSKKSPFHPWLPEK